VTSLSFNNNSNYLAYGSTLGHLKIWNLKSSNTQLNQKLSNNYITSMSFNSDSSHLSVGTAGGDIVNYNMMTLSPTNFKFQTYFKLNLLKYSPLIPNLMGSSFDDGSIRVFDMTSGEIINNFGGYHQGPCTSFSFSPINKVFLCSVGMDSRVNFFDISAKKHIKAITTESPITSVCFNNDGQTIACGNTNGNIVLYDLRYFSTPKAILKGHSSQINYLEFSKKITKKENSNNSVTLQTEKSVQNIQNIQNVQSGKNSSKVEDNLSMSMKSNRSFGTIDTNIPGNQLQNLQNNYVNDQSIMKTEVNVRESSYIDKSHNQSNLNISQKSQREVPQSERISQMGQIGQIGQMSQMGQIGQNNNISFKNSASKNEFNNFKNSINIDYKDHREIKDPYTDKKKQDFINTEKIQQNNYLNSNIKISSNFSNSNLPIEGGNKTKINITPLNLRQSDNIIMQDMQDVDVQESYNRGGVIYQTRQIQQTQQAQSINLDGKVQNFIQNCIETEMFKLRGFIHDEINSLHVDLVRQFEIQHVK
jgi:WD40 repeat protein